MPKRPFSSRVPLPQEIVASFRNIFEGLVAGLAFRRVHTGVDAVNTTSFELCSGALVAPNVVLTARHCVSVQTSTQVTCDQNGVSATPPDFGADEPIGIIHVFTGASPSLLGTPAANAHSGAMLLVRTASHGQRHHITRQPEPHGY